MYRYGVTPNELEKIKNVLSNQFYVRDFVVENVNIYNKLRSNDEINKMGKSRIYIY